MKRLALCLIIAVAALALSESALAAGITNASILYGWNGSEFAPVQIDSDGSLKTSLNLSESFGMNPYADGLYDIGSSSMRWANGYFFNLQVYGNITLLGNINISGLTFSNGTVQVQTGNFTIDPIDTILFVDTTNNRTGIGTGNPSYLFQTASGVAGKSVNLSSALYVNGSSGRVGIGTENPTTPLHVAGDTNITGSLFVAGQNLTRITNNTLLFGYNQSGNSFAPVGITDGGALKLSIVESSGIGGWVDDGGPVRLATATDLVGIGTAIPTDKLQVSGNFSVRNGTGDAVLFVNNVTGKVGIRTTNPSQALEVAGHINVTGGKTSNSTFNGDVRILGTLYGGSPLKIGSGINISTGSGEDALFVSDGSGNKIFRITESGKLNITTSAGNFSVDDSTLFVDVTNNLVGIGTVSPNYLLQAASGTDGRSVNLSNVLYVNGSSGVVHVRNGSDSNILLGKQNPAGVQIEYLNDVGDTQWNFISRYDNANSQINFKTRTLGTAVNAMTILGSGNVGIGTTIPDVKLHVVVGTDTTTVLGNSTNSIMIDTGQNAAATNVELQFGGWSGRSYDFAAITGIRTSTDSFTQGDLVFSIKPNVLSTSLTEAMRIKSSGNVGIGTTSPTSRLEVQGGDVIIKNSTNSLWGTGVDGAVANMADSDTNSVTLAQTGATTVTHNRIYRATSTITISQAVTVRNQPGQARGSYPTTHGGRGVELGAIMAALGSKGIPPLMVPGGGTKTNGGVVQFIAKGNIAISANINASGNNSGAEGGGGGGLVVIISNGTISGTGAINVSGANGGNVTANARGGAGGYSGEPGGHAGIGGSGGGAAARNGDAGAGPGAGGAGFIAGKAGGSEVTGGGGGGGGSLDNVGADASGGVGGVGGAGDGILNYSAPKPSIFYWGGNVRPLPATSASGTTGNGGAGGVNGGGGGGGGTNGGNGGTATSANGVGSGGGGGANGGGATAGGNGGNGSPGSPYLYVLSSNSIYAGLPGGQGGGGGGGGADGTSGGTGGTGGTGSPGIQPFVSNMGARAGGAGASGTNGVDSPADDGGAGGNGGNGGGAAGMVIMIAPTITYTGTVEGRLIQITDAEAVKMIRGFYTD